MVFPSISHKGSKTHPGSLDSARSFVLDMLMLQRMQPLRDKDLRRLAARKRRALEGPEADGGRKRKAEVLGNGQDDHGLNAWDAGAQCRVNVAM